MKQCNDCPTFKKADNCIICKINIENKLKKISIEYPENIRNNIQNILNLPIEEYKKLEQLQEYINSQMFNSI